jgi:hypothetical protein
MASTVREESYAMNRASVPPKGFQSAHDKPLQRAVGAREVGLGLIRRINRWLIAGAVAAAGLFSLLAAHAFHGHTVTAGGASSSAALPSGSPSGIPQSASSAAGSGLQAPGQAPAPAPAAPAPVVSGGS